MDKSSESPGSGALAGSGLRKKKSLRPLDTKRPFTPSEQQHTLFGNSTSYSGRPPSSSLRTDMDTSQYHQKRTSKASDRVVKKTLAAMDKSSGSPVSGALARSGLRKKKSIRPLDTKRPFTPSEQQRTLFGNSTSYSERPPSSSLSLGFLQRQDQVLGSTSSTYGVRLPPLPKRYPTLPPMVKNICELPPLPKSTCHLPPIVCPRRSLPKPPRRLPPLPVHTCRLPPLNIPLDPLQHHSARSSRMVLMPTSPSEFSLLQEPEHHFSQLSKPPTRLPPLKTTPSNLPPLPRSLSSISCSWGSTRSWGSTQSCSGNGDECVSSPNIPFTSLGMEKYLNFHGPQWSPSKECLPPIGSSGQLAIHGNQFRTSTSPGNLPEEVESEDNESFVAGNNAHESTEVLRRIYSSPVEHSFQSEEDIFNSAETDIRVSSPSSESLLSFDVDPNNGKQMSDEDIKKYAADEWGTTTNKMDKKQGPDSKTGTKRKAQKPEEPLPIRLMSFSKVDDICSPSQKCKESDERKTKEEEKSSVRGIIQETKLNKKNEQPYAAVKPTPCRVRTNPLEDENHNSEEHIGSYKCASNIEKCMRKKGMRPGSAMSVSAPIFQTSLAPSPEAIYLASSKEVLLAGSEKHFDGRKINDSYRKAQKTKDFIGVNVMTNSQVDEVFSVTPKGQKSAERKTKNEEHTTISEATQVAATNKKYEQPNAAMRPIHNKVNSEPLRDEHHNFEEHISSCKNAPNIGETRRNKSIQPESAGNVSEPLFETHLHLEKLHLTSPKEVLLAESEKSSDGSKTSDSYSSPQKTENFTDANIMKTKNEEHSTISGVTQVAATNKKYEQPKAAMRPIHNKVNSEHLRDENHNFEEHLSSCKSAPNIGEVRRKIQEMRRKIETRLHLEKLHLTSPNETLLAESEKLSDGSKTSDSYSSPQKTKNFTDANIMKTKNEEHSTISGVTQVAATNKKYEQPKAAMRPIHNKVNSEHLRDENHNFEEHLSSCKSAPSIGEIRRNKSIQLESPGNVSVPLFQTHLHLEKLHLTSAKDALLAESEKSSDGGKTSDSYSRPQKTKNFTDANIMKTKNEEHSTISGVTQVAATNKKYEQPKAAMRPIHNKVNSEPLSDGNHNFQEHLSSCKSAPNIGEIRRNKSIQLESPGNVSVPLFQTHLHLEKLHGTSAKEVLLAESEKSSDGGKTSDSYSSPQKTKNFTDANIMKTKNEEHSTISGVTQVAATNKEYEQPKAAKRPIHNKVNSEPVSDANHNFVELLSSCKSAPNIGEIRRNESIQLESLGNVSVPLFETHLHLEKLHLTSAKEVLLAESENSSDGGKTSDSNCGPQEPEKVTDANTMITKTEEQSRIHGVTQVAATNKKYEQPKAAMRSIHNKVNSEPLSDENHNFEGHLSSCKSAPNIGEIRRNKSIQLESPGNVSVRLFETHLHLEELHLTSAKEVLLAESEESSDGSKTSDSYSSPQKTKNFTDANIMKTKNEEHSTISGVTQVAATNKKYEQPKAAMRPIHNKVNSDPLSDENHNFEEHLSSCKSAPNIGEIRRNKSIQLESPGNVSVPLFETHLHLEKLHLTSAKEVLLAESEESSDGGETSDFYSSPQKTKSFTDANIMTVCQVDNVPSVIPMDRESEERKTKDKEENTITGVTRVTRPNQKNEQPSTTVEPCQSQVITQSLEDENHNSEEHLCSYKTASNMDRMRRDEDIRPTSAGSISVSIFNPFLPPPDKMYSAGAKESLLTASEKLSDEGRISDFSVNENVQGTASSESNDYPYRSKWKPANFKPPGPLAIVTAKSAEADFDTSPLPSKAAAAIPEAIMDTVQQGILDSSPLKQTKFSKKGTGKEVQVIKRRVSKSAKNIREAMKDGPIKSALNTLPKLSQGESNDIDVTVIPETSKAAPAFPEAISSTVQQNLLDRFSLEQTKLSENGTEKEVQVIESSVPNSANDIKEAMKDEPVKTALNTLTNLLQGRNNDNDVIFALSNLYKALERENHFGSNAANSRVIKCEVFKSVFDLVERSNETLLLQVARILLAFRVTGSNLSGVCKLIFKVARCDENDKLFLEENLLELFVEALWSASPIDDAEACIYGYGALKFLTMNGAVLSSVLRFGILELMVQHMNLINNSRSEGCGIPESTNHALFQLTGALRNFAGEENIQPQFVLTGAVYELCRAVELFSSDLDVISNLSRTLSVVSTNEYCCNVIIEYKNSFRLFVKVLQRYPGREDIVVRLCYALGNLMTINDVACSKLYEEEKAVSSLLDLLSMYVRKEQQMQDIESTHQFNSSDTESSGSVEDVVVKIIRVLANMSLCSKVGRNLSGVYPGDFRSAFESNEVLRQDEADMIHQSSNRFLNIILGILRHKNVCSSDKLAYSTLSTLNNLSFYSCGKSTLGERQLEIAEVLIPILDSENGECVRETLNILCNLTREQECRNYLFESGGLAKTIQFLNSEDGEVLRPSVGILVNMVNDYDKRFAFKQENGIQRLIMVLKNFGREDWDLASLVCTALWRYCRESSKVHVAFGFEETEEIEDILLDYSDKKLVFGIKEGNEANETLKSSPAYQKWDEFSRVATELLEKINDSFEDPEGLPSPDQGMSEEHHLWEETATGVINTLRRPDLFLISSQPHEMVSSLFPVMTGKPQSAPASAAKSHKE